MAVWQIARIIAVKWLFHIELPTPWVFLPPVIVILSNIWLSMRVTVKDRPVRVTDAAFVTGMFVIDILCLTATLMLSGGPENPYSALYLVDIALSPTILRKRQTWALGTLACLCFACVFRFYLPIPALEIYVRGDSTVHRLGIWLAFALATCLVTVFSGKISELLFERTHALLHVREELAKKDRLASLATLAAGAAHELSTPLATIAVVAKELERFATRSVPNAAIARDSRLIRTEVDRCRHILRRMSIEGGEPAGEAMATLTVDALLAEVRGAFPVPDRLQAEIENSGGAIVVTIPRHAVEQALIALIENAFDASPADEPVWLRVSTFGRPGHGSVRFEIKDHGCGMSAESLRHAGEPFYTTKEPGKGMGLGVFLARTLAERLGGRLLLNSSDAGTTATMEVPLSHAAAAVTI